MKQKLSSDVYKKLKKTDDIYVIHNDNTENTVSKVDKKEPFKKDEIKKLTASFSSKAATPPHAFSTISELTQKDISLLPLISWIRSHDNNNKADFNYYYTKAVHYFDKW